MQSMIQQAVALKARWYGALKSVAADRGYRPGWAAYKFHEKFGLWPDRLLAAPMIEPTAEVLAFVADREREHAESRSAAFDRRFPD